MRGIAEALAAAGFHVEMPLLPGHGTTVEDMIPTGWSDWSGAAEAAYRALAARSRRVVVVGLSMGGALTLWLGAEHDEIAGLVCVNPATQTQPAEVIEMVRGMIEGGAESMPAIGSDIADPDVTESAYEATPLRPLVSFLVDGMAPLQERYPAMRQPLLLLSSPQDHVVEPAQGDFLASTYGGEVTRVSLDRSFHVATMDYDKALVEERTVAFALSVCA
jgi:carboxylesterase